MVTAFSLLTIAFTLSICTGCDTQQTIVAQSTATPLPCGLWQSTITSQWADTSGEFSAILTFSASDVWTVGSKYPTDWKQSAFHHWNGKEWNAVPSPDFKPYAELVAIAGTHDDNIWSVGSSTEGLTSQNLIVHWDGGRWTQVPSPNLSGVQNQLNGVALASADDGWTVGGYQSRPDSFAYYNHYLILHWNGREWSPAQGPELGVAQSWLSAVNVLTPNDVWAVGAYTDSTTRDGLTPWWPLVLHWNGQSWQQITIPNPVKGVSLYAVSSLSPNDVWAVGTYEYNFGAVMHWDGIKWNTEYGANVADGDLHGVAAISSSNVWAAGYRMEGPWRIPIVIHTENSKWVSVDSPKPLAEIGFSGVAKDPNGGIWLAGMAFKGEEDTPVYGLVSHTNGTSCPPTTSTPARPLASSTSSLPSQLAISYRCISTLPKK